MVIPGGNYLARRSSSAPRSPRSCEEEPRRGGALRRARELRPHRGREPHGHRHRPPRRRRRAQEVDFPFRNSPNRTECRNGNERWLVRRTECPGVLASSLRPALPMLPPPFRTPPRGADEASLPACCWSTTSRSSFGSARSLERLGRRSSSRSRAPRDALVLLRADPSAVESRAHGRVDAGQVGALACTGGPGRAPRSSHDRRDRGRRPQQGRAALRRGGRARRAHRPTMERAIDRALEAAPQPWTPIRGSAFSPALAKGAVRFSPPRPTGDPVETAPRAPAGPRLPLRAPFVSRPRRAARPPCGVRRGGERRRSCSAPRARGRGG